MEREFSLIEGVPRRTLKKTVLRVRVLHFVRINNNLRADRPYERYDPDDLHRPLKL